MELHNWQLEADSRLKKEGGLCLWADTGLGKGFLGAFIAPPGSVIVCPAHLIGDWVEKLQEAGKQTHILNYRGAQISEREVNIVSIQRLTRSIDELFMIWFPLLIIDEAHRVKNWKGKGYKAVLKLSKWSRRRLLISATFQTRDNVDLFAPAFIASHEFKNAFRWSFWKFAGDNIKFQSMYLGTRTVQQPVEIRKHALEKWILPHFSRVTYQSAGIPEPMAAGSHVIAVGDTLVHSFGILVDIVDA